MADKVINGSLDVTGEISQNGHSIVPRINVTWAELKALRDGGTLVPGQQYRITDYQCTTTQGNTSSANHQFDVIVLALEDNKLSEEAWAAHHAGDGYFANSKLEAWKIWYCLDNDTTRFNWAQIISGPSFSFAGSSWPTTMLYRDESKDESGYYAFSGTHTQSGTNITVYTTTLDLVGGKCNYSSSTGTATYSPTNMTKIYQKSGSSISLITTRSYEVSDVKKGSDVDGKGVIYRMIDEFGNDCPYDFKNVLFTGVSYDGSITYTDAYTFNYIESVNQDASLKGIEKSCLNNVIKGFELGASDLPFNVFYSAINCYNNTFGTSCFNNTFGSYCSNNTFGSYCSDNTFGTSCSSNTFGTYCYSNILGSACSYNIFDTACSNNTFGSACTRNTFSCDCYCNVFGDYCSYNTFGNYCFYNTFGSSSSTIGYCRYVILDNGCEYLYIDSTDTSASYSNYLQNVHVHLGVSGSSSSNRKTLTVPDRNLAYETNFIANSSNDIIV